MTEKASPITRRSFVQTTTAAAAAMMFPSGVRAQGSDVIKVGVVGTGGRGTGAIRDILMSSEGVEIRAIGDLNPDRLEQSRMQLDKESSNPAFGPRYKAGFKVTGDSVYTGFDAYKRVLASDIDLVILATPPGFRPIHLAAAVAAGKHVFTEKPVATDSVGIRSVFDTYEAALKRGLGIGAGTQRRHQAEYLEAMKRIHDDGAIGDVVSGQVFWNQGGLWNHKRLPSWSDTEWQIRNWLYFAWLSGDHIVEQHVHNIDVANWIMRGHPVRAIGVGGRQQRTDPIYGHIYDHFAVDFEYESGARVLSMCRQIEGTRNRVGENFIGTRGRAELSNTGSSRIVGQNAWTYRPMDKPVSPYVQEHTNLVASIRAGKPINELKQVAESTLTAIMGREAAYTGMELTWDEVLKADLNLLPPTVAYGPLEVPPVPIPGVTKLNRTWKDEVAKAVK